MSLYLGGLLVGVSGMTIWVFFWRLSENERLLEPVRVFMNVPLAFGILIFGLSFLNLIGIWLDLCKANSYGLAVAIAGLMITFIIEVVAGTTVGLLPFLIINKVKSWHLKLHIA
ncbi:MAG: hypothetical protein Q8P06_00775 [Candidatus Azambacteria bacterium]|nr:hypothetical protein [Candidatus Azambacteria bacterium]